MIGLFKGNTTKADLLKYNGDYMLDSICTYGRITENKTEFYLELNLFCPKAQYEDIYNLVTYNSIIKLDDEYGDEFFRICDLKRQGKFIIVYARQISIQDTLTMFVEDARAVNMNGQASLQVLFNGATTPNKFTVYSDISATNTAYWLKKTVYEALTGGDNSFINRWGGEIQRRGFTIRVNEKIGSNRGVVIQSRKNLISLEEASNLDKIATRIYPQGFDGITITEKYLDSPIINLYPEVYSKTVKWDDIRVNDETFTEGYATLEEAQAELKARTQKLYENGEDRVKASYRAVFAELGKSEEYKNYSILEATSVGDTVKVYDEETGIDIDVRVTERKYDVVNKKRLETSLSNYDNKPISIGDIIGSVDDIIDKVEDNKNNINNAITEAKEHANAIIEAGIKNSYVVVRKNEILVMDSTDINTAVKVWRWNNGGLAYSPSGYFGTYQTAITNDGAIVADFITTGVLTANVIRAGIVMSLTGDTWINIENGTFCFADKVKYDGKAFTIDNGHNLKIDDMGISVEHKDKLTKTKMDAEGFYILDENGETMASLASAEQWTELKANKLFAENIENIYDGISNLYINYAYTGISDGSIDKPFKCFGDIDNLLNQVGRIVNKDITIHVATTSMANDTIIFKGIKGSGSIKVVFDSNKSYRILFMAYDVDITLDFVGGDKSNKAVIIGNGINESFKFVNCKRVKIQYFNAIGKMDAGHSPTFGYYDNSTGLLYDCDISNYYSVVESRYGGSVYMRDCKGSNLTYSGVVHTASVLGCYGMIPNAEHTENYGGIYKEHNTVKTNSSFVAPDIPPTSKYSKTFNKTALGTYQYAWSNWSVGEAKQGIYSTYGNKAGHLFFNISAIREFIGNGTILEGNTITLTRRNAGGYSSATNIYINGSSASGASGTPSYINNVKLGTLIWGETKTFVLPKNIVTALKNGTANSLACYSSSDGAYAQITEAKINIKVNK